MGPRDPDHGPCPGSHGRGNPHRPAHRTRRPPCAKHGSVRRRRHTRAQDNPARRRCRTAMLASICACTCLSTTSKAACRRPRRLGRAGAGRTAGVRRVPGGKRPPVASRAESLTRNRRPRRRSPRADAAKAKRGVQRLKPIRTRPDTLPAARQAPGVPSLPFLFCRVLTHVTRPPRVRGTSNLVDLVRISPWWKVES